MLIPCFIELGIVQLQICECENRIVYFIINKIWRMKIKPNFMIYKLIFENVFIVHSNVSISVINIYVKE